MEELMKWQKEAEEVAKHKTTYDEEVMIEIEDEDEVEWIEDHKYYVIDYIEQTFGGQVSYYELNENDGITYINFTIITKDDVKDYIEAYEWFDFDGCDTSIKESDMLSYFGMDINLYNGLYWYLEDYAKELIEEKAKKEGGEQWEGYISCGKIGAFNTDKAYKTFSGEIRPYEEDVDDVDDHKYNNFYYKQRFSIIKYNRKEDYPRLILTFFRKIVENSKKHQATNEIIFEDFTYTARNLNLGDILILNFDLDLYKEIDGDGLVNKWWSGDEEDEYLKSYEKVAKYENAIRYNIEGLIKETDKGMYKIELPALYERMGLDEQCYVSSSVTNNFFNEFNRMTALLLKERLEQEHCDSEFDWAATQGEAMAWDTDMWNVHTMMYDWRNNFNESTMEEEDVLERVAEDIAKNYQAGSVCIRITDNDFEWVLEHPDSTYGILSSIFDGILFNYELTHNDKSKWIKFNVMTKDEIRHNIESMNLNFNGYETTFKLKDALKEWGLDYDAINDIDVNMEQFIADYVAELANKEGEGHWQAYCAHGRIGAVNTDLAYVTGRFDEIRPYNEEDVDEEN